MKRKANRSRSRASTSTLSAAARRRLSFSPAPEVVERRLLLAYSAAILGSAATFTGFPASPSGLILTTEGGFLKHNQSSAGDPDYASDFDFDTAQAGVQNLSNNTGGSIDIVESLGGTSAYILSVGTATAAASAIQNTTIRSLSTPGLGSLYINDTANGAGVQATIQATSIIFNSSNLVINIAGAPLVSNTLNLGNGSNNLTLAGTNANPYYIYGGTGQEIFSMAPAATFKGIIYAGAGNDTLSYALFSASDPVTVDLSLATGTGLSTGSSFINIETVFGGSGDDNLTGNDQVNLIAGGDGNDFISGLGGADSLQGGGGLDTIHGGADIDSLEGGDGNDSLSGGDGNDRVYGDEGNDILSGGEGNDLVYGDNGNDTLDGDNGNDSLTGGEGNDFIIGSAGTDTLEGGLGNDSLSGGVGDDVLLGEAGDDLLDGGEDNDSLVGGPGKDTLLGNAGNDTLVGFPGEDVLDPGTGDDVLPGLVSDFGYDDAPRADYAVYRPSTQQWFMLNNLGSTTVAVNASSGVTWGLPGDIPLKGDFTGDSRCDFAVYRPSSRRWYVLSNPASPAVVYTPGIQWGMPGDVPVPGDYNGDGKMDYAVFSPPAGKWFMLDNTGPGTGAVNAANWVNWGLPGDIPVPGDYTGDGKSDFAVYRPATGQWFVLQNQTGPMTIFTNGIKWGLPGDIPVPADYSGDRKMDLAVYRPSTQEWFVLDNLNGGSGYWPNALNGVRWGLAGDLPVPADYNADGKFDFAVYRPSTQQWHILASKVPPKPYALAVQWGLPGDIPVVKHTVTFASLVKVSASARGGAASIKSAAALPVALETGVGTSVSVRETLIARRSGNRRFSRPAD